MSAIVWMEVTNTELGGTGVVSGSVLKTPVRREEVATIAELWKMVGGECKWDIELESTELMEGIAVSRKVVLLGTTELEKVLDAVVNDPVVGTEEGKVGSAILNKMVWEASGVAEVRTDV